MFIVISLVLFIIIAFAVCITVFRQTKAIWKMNNINAITINNTLNSFSIIEPLLVIIAIVIAIACLGTVRAGFR